MEDIWRIALNPNIFKCCPIYKKISKTFYCLGKKIFIILIQIFGDYIYLKIENLSLKIIEESLLIIFF